MRDYPTNLPLSPESSAIFHILPLDATIIYPSVYRKEIWEAKEKGRRNVEIFERALAADPDDVFNYYNLGQEYYTGRDFAPALAHFEQTLVRRRPLSEPPSFLAYVYALATGTCVELRQLARGLEIGEEGATRFEYADLFCNLGSCYLLSSNFDRAAHYSARALVALGRADDTRRYPQQVLARLPDHEEAKLVMVDLLVASQYLRGAHAYGRESVRRAPANPRLRI